MSIGKNVTIHIKGTQAGESAEKLETIVPGTYYFRGGKHYLLYEEAVDGVEMVTANRIKLTSDRMELTRKGPVQTFMIFAQGKTCPCTYRTPYGTISLEIFTKHLALSCGEDMLEADASYELLAQGSTVSENHLHIIVKEQDELDEADAQAASSSERLSHQRVFKNARKVARDIDQNL